MSAGQPRCVPSRPPPASSSRGFLYCVTPTSLPHISAAPKSCRGTSQGKLRGSHRSPTIPTRTGLRG